MNCIKRNLAIAVLTASAILGIGVVLINALVPSTPPKSPPTPAHWDISPVVFVVISALLIMVLIVRYRHAMGK